MVREQRGRPNGNRRQNRQVDDAANEVGLTREQRWKLGEEVELESRRFGADLSYADIVEIARLIVAEN